MQNKPPPSELVDERTLYFSSVDGVQVRDDQLMESHAGTRQSGAFAVNMRSASIFVAFQSCITKSFTSIFGSVVCV
jgi:hypothetical protein